jgi:hypothetical protein
VHPLTPCPHLGEGVGGEGETKVKYEHLSLS